MRIARFLTPAMTVLAVLASTSKAIAVPPPEPSLIQGNQYGFTSSGDYNMTVNIGFGNYWRSGNSSRGNFLHGMSATFGSMVTSAKDDGADFAVYHDINLVGGVCGAVPTVAGSDVSLQCGLGLFFNNTNGFTVTDTGGLLSYSSEGATVLWSSATQETMQTFTILAEDNEVCRVVTVTLENGVTNTNIADGACVAAGSPASELSEHEADIRNMLVEEASRSLRSSVTANQRMTQSARGRFISARQAKVREEDVTRALIPFDVAGNFTLSEDGLSTAGNFFQQVGNEEGTYRRLFFGDFDVQHDNETDSTTATLTGRMAWEQMTTEQTLLGYFIGGELATSTIGGSFEGDQDRIGVTAGGYVVHELAQQVYFDGFASVGAGRNNLEIANDTLALESEYTTRTATLGGAITGVYSQKGYDFKPELAFSYGKTWLGDVGFTGTAYGITDNTLSLDAGDVSIASLTFRPEVIIPIGADFVADTNTQLSFAPRLICEQIKSTTKTSDCGTGGELGFSSTSEDGLSSAHIRLVMDRVGNSNRSSFALNFERSF